jgi:hypothetical protein
VACGGRVASGTPYRGSIESTDESRTGGADIFRDLQCPGSVYVDTGCFIAVCLRIPSLNSGRAVVADTYLGEVGMPQVGQPE